MEKKTTPESTQKISTALWNTSYMFSSMLLGPEAGNKQNQTLRLASIWQTDHGKKDCYGEYSTLAIESGRFALNAKHQWPQGNHTVLAGW